MPKKLPKGLGLRELPPDSRDIQLGAVIKLPKLDELPPEFRLSNTFPVKDQKGSDFCSAYASCVLSEMQEDIELEPAWSFAVSKMLSGDVDGYGQDLRSAMAAHTKYGALPKKDTPFSVGDQPDSYLRRIENWPRKMFDKAFPQKKKAYVFVTGPYDHFDNIRATIWYWFTKGEKRGVLLGVAWGWPIEQVVMEDAGSPYGGHALADMGWVERDEDQYLYIRGSYGTDAGENGYHYFSRQVINENVERYGAGMFVDMSKEELRELLKKKQNPKQSWWFLEIIKRLWQ